MYNHKLVRDLSWLMQSRPLWSDSLHICGSAEEIQEQLQQIDADVTPLEDFMCDDSVHPPCSRLQSYMGALLQFWYMRNHTRTVLSTIHTSWHRLALDIKLLADVGAGACLHHECEVVFGISPGPDPLDTAAESQWEHWAYHHIRAHNNEALEALNNHLSGHTYLVGHRATAADQRVATQLDSLGLSFKQLRPSYPHVARWLRTLQSCEGIQQSQLDPSLAQVVTVDLEANLMHKAMLSRFKRNVAHAPAVQAWALNAIGCDRMVSSLCLCGDIFTPLTASSKQTRWWVESVDTLLSHTSADSRWALVEQRHMLAAANVMKVHPNQLHFSRAHGMRPHVVALTPAGCDVCTRIPRVELVKGARGLKVQQLQELFVILGLLTAHDVRYKIGVFGESTAMAVGALQQILGVNSTGSYDKQTAHALRLLLELGMPEWSPVPSASAIDVVEGCLAVMIPHVPLLEPRELRNRPDSFGSVPLSAALSAQLTAIEQFAHLRSTDSYKWLDGEFTPAEQTLLHCHAAKRLHLGHLSIGLRVLIWCWASWGGPLIHQVRWGLELRLEGCNECWPLKFRGTLYEGILAPDAVDKRLTNPNADESINHYLSKACLKRETDECGARWYLILSKLEPIELEIDLTDSGESVRVAELTLDDGRTCSVLFREAELVVSGGRGERARVDPVALIEFERTASGSWSEKSRGWLVGEEWESTAALLRSTEGAPRCKQQLPGGVVGKIGKSAHWSLLSFAGALKQEAAAILSSDAAEWKVPITKEWKLPPKELARLEIPSETVDGRVFLEAFSQWQVHQDLNGVKQRVRNGQGLLHSAAATATLRSAIYTTDQPLQLLVDLVLTACPENKDGDEAGTTMPVLHAIVGSMAGQVDFNSISSAGENQKRYTGECRDMHVTILRMIAAAIGQIRIVLNEGRKETLSTGACRLPVKVLRLLTNNKVRDADTYQREVQRTSAIALEFASETVNQLSEGEEDGYVHAALGAAIEVLLVLGQPLCEEDAIEWLHWLVRGAQWAECEAIASCRALQLSLIDECQSIRNTKAATKYATNYGLLSTKVTPLSCSNSTTDYPRFVLPETVKVVLVSDSTNFSLCIEQLIPGQQPIGLDAEWKPFVHSTDANPVALLQLSTSTCVWLLDLVQLDERLLPQLWAVLRECTVVGFGLSGDLHQLNATFPSMAISFQYAVELQEMVPQGTASLNHVCQLLLGCQLDKTMQTSNWANRPLTSEQIQYAAADSYVLLLILTSILMPAPATSLPVTIHQVQHHAHQIMLIAQQSAQPLNLGTFHPTVSKSGLLLQRVEVEKALRDRGLESSANSIRCRSGPARLKTVILTMADSSIVACVLSSRRRVHIGRCAVACGVKRCDIRMLKNSELADRVGYRCNAVGPYGLRGVVAAILVDKELLSEDTLELNAGEDGLVFEISTCSILNQPDAKSAVIHADLPPARLPEVQAQI